MAGSLSVTVTGAAVHYEAHGDPTAPALVLVHGGTAHLGWWTAVIPQLAQRYRVLALDLSGHGESEHRAAYTPELWADEVVAVMRQDGTGAGTVVGHSMGGAVALAAADRHPAAVRRVVLVDTRMPLRGHPPGAPGRVRHYATAEEALGRFRLVPDATIATPELLARVARQGLVRDAEGWRWRFDPATRRRFTVEGVDATIASLTCPLGYVYGGRSPMRGVDAVRHAETLLGREVPTVGIPEAYHHVPLDAPLRCAEAVVRLLEGSPVHG